jgi:hypothetical protein
MAAAFKLFARAVAIVGVTGGAFYNSYACTKGMAFVEITASVGFFLELRHLAVWFGFVYRKARARSCELYYIVRQCLNLPSVPCANFVTAGLRLNG